MKIPSMSAKTLRTMLQNCPTGILALDARRRVLWANAALDNLLGIEPDALVGRSAQNLARADLQALFSETAHLSVLGVDGEPRHLFRTRITGETGDTVAELHYFSDQTDRIRLEDQLAQARQDAHALRLVEPDTGLMSQRALMLVLEPQVARSRRYNNPLAAVVLRAELRDADQASAAARGISQVLKDQLRWADLVGRDDDGDFLVVLPETSRDAAAALTDKLAQALQRNPHVGNCYFGIVEWVKSDNAAGLLQRAREAMIQAQQGGGPNRIAR